MLELVDKRDLKSLGQKCPYGFDPRPEHSKRGWPKNDFGSPSNVFLKLDSSKPLTLGSDIDNDAIHHDAAGDYLEAGADNEAQKRTEGRLQCIGRIFSGVIQFH